MRFCAKDLYTISQIRLKAGKKMVISEMDVPEEEINDKSRAN